MLKQKEIRILKKISVNERNRKTKSTIETAVEARTMEISSLRKATLENVIMSELNS
jgi:ribonuclease PH